MSSTVAEAKRREASTMRSTTSPVPPATSSTDQPARFGGFSQVASAARHVEDMFAWPWLHLCDEAVLPQPVQAARHQVVHQVVAVGDPVEDVVDQRLLLAGAHLAVAKGGLHASAGRDALI